MRWRWLRNQSRSKTRIWSAKNALIQTRGGGSLDPRKEVDKVVGDVAKVKNWRGASENMKGNGFCFQMSNLLTRTCMGCFPSQVYCPRWREWYEGSHWRCFNRGYIFLADWHRAQVCHLFPQQCLWTQFMTPLLVATLLLDHLVNLYVEPITLWCTRRWRRGRRRRWRCRWPSKQLSAVVESPSVILIIIPASEVCFGHDFSVQIYFPRAWYAEVLVTSTWNRQTGLLIVVVIVDEW